MSIWLLLSNFGKNSPITMKFLHVFKQRRFDLQTENSYYVISTFFTRTRQMFKYIIIHFLFEMSRSTTKKPCVFEIQKITSCTRNNYCIIDRCGISTSKFQFIINSFFLLHFSAYSYSIQICKTFLKVIFLMLFYISKQKYPFGCRKL